MISGGNAEIMEVSTKYETLLDTRISGEKKGLHFHETDLVGAKVSKRDSFPNSRPDI